MTKRLIITGDDFGLAVPVNEAVEDAHRSGMLAATSLLVGGRAMEDAVERARRNPRLRVGLHLALCEGHPSLPVRDVPDLVNRRGELRHPLLSMARMLFADRSIRAQIEAEIRAQFEAFRATGLPLDHVNGHNNLQLHPTVLPILVRLAREYGARAIRLPYEPFLPSFLAARRSLGARLLAGAALNPWARRVRNRLRREGFVVNDYLFGLHDCGDLDTALLVGFVRHLPEGVSEIHCHVASRRCPEIDRTMPRYRHEAELIALKSRALREAIETAGVIPLTGFDAITAA